MIEVRLCRCGIDLLQNVADNSTGNATTGCQHRKPNPNNPPRGLPCLCVAWSSALRLSSIFFNCSDMGSTNVSSRVNCAVFKSQAQFLSQDASAYCRARAGSNFLFDLFKCCHDAAPFCEVPIHRTFAHSLSDVPPDIRQQIRARPASLCQISLLQSTTY